MSAWFTPTATALRRLDEEARTARLPPYLPPGADVTTLARTVRVRCSVRTGLRTGLADATADRAYRLPVERAEDSEPPRPWPEVALENRRLVVLADPGLGKSWLVRTETHRLCQQALAAALCGDDVSALLIPVPVRCDQLVASRGEPSRGGHRIPDDSEAAATAIPIWPTGADRCGGDCAAARRSG